MSLVKNWSAWAEVVSSGNWRRSDGARVWAASNRKKPWRGCGPQGALCQPVRSRGTHKMLTFKTQYGAMNAVDAAFPLTRKAKRP